jgi:hypothetical protein
VAVDGGGDLFATVNAGQQLVEVLPNGTQVTLLSNLQIGTGVAVDGVGDVFVADAGQHGVLEILPNGTQLTVGSGLNRPVGLAVDGQGDVFIPDASNQQLVEVTGVLVKVLPPTPGVAGPAYATQYPGVAPHFGLWAARGQVLPFTLTDSDPSAVDQAAGFTFTISWGDGSTQTVTGLSGLTVNHAFPAVGYFQVQVTATIMAGVTSLAATQTEGITALAMEYDPITPGRLAMFVGGTPGSDTIKISGDANDLFTVRINGVSYNKWQVTGHVFVYTQGGNDTVTYQTLTSDVPAFLFAGSGTDTLNAIGSSANNVLVGGTGQDLLESGKGHNLLIAGLGGSTLRSSSGQDILIGGTTDYDSNLAALGAIMAEWGRTDEDFLTRMAHLNGTLGGGANGATLLTKATVHASGVSDKLSAGIGLDWLFAALSGPGKDVLLSLRKGDVITSL